MPCMPFQVQKQVALELQPLPSAPLPARARGVGAWARRENRRGWGGEGLHRVHGRRRVRWE